MINNMEQNDYRMTAKRNLTTSEKKKITTECEKWPDSMGKAIFSSYINGYYDLGCLEAVFAKCAVCCNGYIDGKYDCGDPKCPLYPFMQYLGE